MLSSALVVWTSLATAVLGPAEPLPDPPDEPAAPREEPPVTTPDPQPPAGDTPATAPVEDEPTPPAESNPPEPTPPESTGPSDAPMPPTDERATTPTASPSLRPTSTAVYPKDSPQPEPPSKFVPPGEAERMAPRPLAGGTFKPSGGLTWSSADRRFALNVSLWGQLRYTYEHLAPPPVNRTRDSQSFQVRRGRIVLSGNAFTEHFKYSMHFQFSPADLGLNNGTLRQSPVFWWFVTYDGFRDLVPQAGLFFTPFSRERVEPPWRLQLVDNSIAAYEFGFDRDIGIDLKSLDFLGLDKLRYHLGVFMGEGYDYTVPRDFGLLYVARFEVLPLGGFEDYAEADFVRSSRPKISIGAAYAFNDNDHRRRPLDDAPADLGTTDTHNVTADVVLKVAGFSMLADFFWRTGKRDPGEATMDDGMGGMVPVATELPRNGLGYNVQAGYLIPRTSFEIAGRYAALHPLGDDTSLPRTDEFGPGIGYYFFQHALKLQADYFHQRLPGDATSDRFRLQMTFAF